MKLTREDLLKVREIAAENGSEFTPQETIDFFKQVEPDIEIVDEPGLVTWLRKHGNTSTSRPPIDS